MKNLIKYTLIIVVFTSIVSCNDFLEPIDENRLDIDFVTENPGAAEGLLLNGYSRLISESPAIEAATDNAVSNQLNNGFKQMALGALNAQFNPTQRWNNYESILWVNKFLEILDSGETLWNDDEEINELFKIRLRGEALALRALHHFYILEAHAGRSASGELLGVPYITEFIEANEDFNMPRLSFEATVEAILKDFDDAIELLPTEYSNDESVVRDFYTNRENYEFSKYQVVNGAQLNLRMSGKIAKSYKARLALFAASPSFLNSQVYYNLAATTASEVLNTIGGGGISGLVPSGVEFYISSTNYTSDEVIWRGSEQNPNAGIERQMFPPSVNGLGRVNPTQNFVDAFPMANGFPITEATSNYDPQNPYANRDPRLDKYVVVNGSSFGGGNINTGVGGGIDRLDSVPQISTISGYYLKKLLRPDVRLNNDGSTVGQIHYDVYLRYTELALILAEAANEIDGPNFQVNGISARDVIAALRQRAGISQPDAYLDGISNATEMRELIRNERRIELSFEGQRFWDLRRWGSSLNELAEGAFFDGSNYTLGIPVENRNYPPFATYLPIPNNEVLRFPALEQNNGW